MIPGGSRQVAGRADATHFLYRCYDDSGMLLYIGCTNNPTKRLDFHQHGRGHSVASKWLAACMVRCETSGPIAGREAARAAERTAIAAEQPIFNTQERRVPRGQARNAVARYLITKGYLELAVSTTCTCWSEDRDADQDSPWCVAHRMIAELVGA